MKKKYLACLTVAFGLTLSAQSIAYAQEMKQSQDTNTTSNMEESEKGTGYIEPKMVPVFVNPDKDISCWSIDGRKEKSHVDDPSYRSEYVSTVKDQGREGLCWDFSSTALLESYLMSKNEVKDPTKFDFSEAHMGLATMYDFNNPYGSRALYSDGGNFEQAEAYWTRDLMNGSVYENQFPYDDRTYYDCNNIKDMEPADYYVTRTTKLGNLGPDTDKNDRKYWIKMAKTLVVNEGAASISFYTQESNYKKNEDGTYGYYYPSDLTTNHAVTIVGWDDNYSTDHFKSSMCPKENGAFLIKNSWGKGRFQEGYFWMSYETPMRNLSGILDVKDRSFYDHLYEYDKYDACRTPVATSNESNTIAYANKFRTQNDQTEQLTAISTYFTQPLCVAQTFIGVPDGDQIHFKPISTKLSNEDEYDSSHGLETAGVATFMLEKPIEVSGNFYVAFEVSCSANSVQVAGDGLNAAPNQGFYADNIKDLEDPQKRNDACVKNNMNICLKAYTQEMGDVTEIKLNQNNLEMVSANSCEQLHANVTPASMFHRKINWTSSDESVATVDQLGKVTALKEGKATITAALASNPEVKDTCDIVVEYKEVKLEKISLPSALTVYVGQYSNIQHLDVEFTPSNATNKEIFWLTSDPEVADINCRGYVTAKKPGTAIIKAYLGKDQSIAAECEVTVPPVDLEGLQFTVPSIQVQNYPKKYLPTFVPTTASDQEIVFSSSDTSIAKVDEYGNVKAVGNGEAVITATAVHNDKIHASYTAVCNAGTPAVKSIGFEKNDIQIGYTEKYLQPITDPQYVSCDQLLWSSSNPEVVEVNGGTLKGLKEGEAIITVRVLSNPDLFATCHVTVGDVAIKGITLDQTSVTLENGTIDYYLEATPDPDTASKEDIEWKTLDKTVATVNAGRVNAVGAGSTKIIAYYKKDDKVFASCDVTVTDVKLNHISLEHALKIMNVNTQGLITVNLDPAEPSILYKDFDIISDHPDIVKVEHYYERYGDSKKYQLILTAGSKGNAKITITSKLDSSITASMDVKVVDGTEEEKDDPKSMSIIPGKLALTDTNNSNYLSYTYEPEMNRDLPVTWKSEDKSIATVNENGVVSAVGNGTTYIVATSVDYPEISGKCEVTVTLSGKKEIALSSITLNQNEMNANALGTIGQLTMSTYEPEDATNKELIWDTDNTNVATVDENGNVTAVGEGEATITARVKLDDTVTASCKVKVQLKKNDEKLLTLEANGNSWGEGYGMNFTLTNVSEDNITNWKVELDPSQVTIADIWSAQSDDVDLITAADFNCYIRSKDNTTFGFNGKGTMPSTLSYKVSYEMNGTWYSYTDECSVSAQ